MAQPILKFNNPTKNIVNFPLTGTTIKNKIMSLNFYIIFYRNLDYTNLRTYKYVFYEHPTKIEINESQFFHNTTIMN
jgi:hypothetical protein